MSSKCFGQSCNKASPNHEASSQLHKGQTKPSSNGDHQPSNHDGVAIHVAAQYGTQSYGPTQVPQASNDKPNFAVITTAEWIVHDKMLRWMEEGSGEQPWNDMEASSIEMKEQDTNGGGEQNIKKRKRS